MRHVIASLILLSTCATAGAGEVRRPAYATAVEAPSDRKAVVERELNDIDAAIQAAQQRLIQRQATQQRY